MALHEPIVNKVSISCFMVSTKILVDVAFFLKVRFSELLLPNFKPGGIIGGDFQS